MPDDVPAGVQADGRQILLYRHDGTLHALDNLCSHAAGLLSRGTVEGLTVTCPMHGSQYCLADGSVIRGPSHQPQPVIRTRVRNGWIEVRGNQPAPRGPSTEGNSHGLCHRSNLDDLEPGETCSSRSFESRCPGAPRRRRRPCGAQHLHSPAAAPARGHVQDDDTLVCASHNSRFDLTTGESVGIPVVPRCPSTLQDEGDAILVDIDQQLKDAPIPHRPYH